MNRNSSQAARVWLSTSPSKNTKREDEEEIPRAAAGASASLQRVKRFPGGKERQKRKGAASGQADGEESKTVAKATVGTEKKEKQCSPLHRVEAKSNGA